MDRNNQFKELDALVSLIDEPNEDMYSTIRQKVLTYGKLAIPVLEEAWVNTLGDSDSVRIETLIEEIRRQELIDDIGNWKNKDNPGILEGYTVLMRYLKPDFKEDQFNLLFDRYYREIWLELNEGLTALERIKVFNHVLFMINKLTPVLVPPIKSETYFLSNITDKNKGNEFIVGLIFIAIAQKLSIPIYGVGLPGHFVLAYMDDIKMEKAITDYTGDDVMFYINPGNEGAVFTHNEIRNYISQLELKLNPEYFLPTSNINVLIRIISELITTLESENNLIKKEGLQELLSYL